MSERCDWCKDNGILQKYHDEEWGIPLHDDRKQFEFLMMEVMQCGLNWNMMIQKREIFRQCFDGFDYDKVAAYGDGDVERILAAEGMIRSRRKVEAVIHNARRFREIREEYGSFSRYIWSFSKGKTILYAGHQKGRIPASNKLSDEVSMVEMHVPDTWVGKSLIELDLRGRYGINVIAIKEGENVTIEMNPQEPLRAGQTLGIVGKNEILSRLSETNYQD